MNSEIEEPLKVSIVISCYNDPDIVKAVKCASEQTYANKEIIVVNDGSDVETEKAIATVTHDIDILIFQKNQGQSIARNNGIKKATGEYILNWDSDDFFEPGFCEKAIEIIRHNEKIKIVTCKAKRFTKKGVIDIFTPAGGELKNFLFSNAALGSAMFRRSDWERCGGYEEKLPILGFEDWEFYIQLLKSGGFAYVIPEILFNYQIRANSTTKRIGHLRNKKFEHIILKHSDIYKQNFRITINHLFDRIGNSEAEKNKIFSKPEHRVGALLLKPFRLIKKMWKI